MTARFNHPQRRLCYAAQTVPAARLDQNLHAMLASQPRQRRGSGTENSTCAIPICFYQSFLKFKRRRLHPAQIFVMDQEQSQSYKRWISMITSIANFLGVIVDIDNIV